jgi:DNA-binding PadR family transcriptional regulator
MHHLSHEGHGRGGRHAPRHAFHHRGSARHLRGRGGPRARRGDIRAAVLGLLAERPMHGYEMIQELEQRTKGIWKPSAGSVYPTLQLLEEEGLIRGTDADGKRCFELTEAGAEAEQAHEGDAAWDQVTSGLEPEVFRMRKSFQQLTAAIGQAMKAADDESKRAKIRELLDDTRKEVYGILAED